MLQLPPERARHRLGAQGGDAERGAARAAGKHRVLWAKAAEVRTKAAEVHAQAAESRAAKAETRAAYYEDLCEALERWWRTEAAERCMELDAAREKRIKAVKACRDGDADDYELFEFASRMQIYEAQEAELLAPGGAACVDRAYMREMSAEMSAYMGWRVSVSLWDLLGRPHAAHGLSKERTILGEEPNQASAGRRSGSCDV